MNENVLQIAKTDNPDHLHLKLSGIINEEAQLGFFKELPGGKKVVINTKEVARINSCGVREWILALKSVPQGLEIVYEECSPAFMDQVNMITNFASGGTIKSLYIPYVCGSCDKKSEELCDLEANMTADGLELPEVKCPGCQNAMELADDPEQLF